MSASELTTDPWKIDPSEYPSDAPIEERARFLLRYAILAPSSHNSQPWSFAVDGATIEVQAEESRRLEVADPDRRELHLSIGCAVENLLIAAARFDLGTTIEYGCEGGDDGPLVTVTVDPGSSAEIEGDAAALFGAIVDRRTGHGAFEDRPVPTSTLDRFEELVRDPGVDLLLVEGGSRKQTIAELQAEADELRMDEAAYRRELGHWIGIGALGASWLAARIGQIAVTYLDLGEREGKKNSRLIESAPVVAVLATTEDTVEARLRAGRAFERVALAATLEGLVVHPMSQILERPASKAELADLLDRSGSTPQHLFRLGFADENGEHTPRWPVSSVLQER